MMPCQWTLIVAGLIAAAEWSARRRLREHSLSCRVSHELRLPEDDTAPRALARAARGLHHDLRGRGRAVYYTVLLLLVIGSQVALCWLLVGPAALLLGSVDYDWEARFLSDLWQVQASVMATTFVVVVLAVQIAGQRIKTETLFRRYVDESRVGTIASFGLVLSGELALARLLAPWLEAQAGWLGPAVCALTVCFLCYCAATAQLWFVASEFQSPKRIHRLRMKGVMQALSEELRAVARRHLADALLEQECSRLGLRFARTFLTRTDWIPVNSSRLGQVVDVNLQHLRELGLELGACLSGESTPAVYLLKGLGSRVTQDSPTLARVDPGRMTVSVEGSVRRAFVIGPPRDHGEDVLPYELDMLRDDAFATIRNGQLAGLEDILEAYCQLYDCLFEKRAAYSIAERDSEAFRSQVVARPLSFLVRDAYAIVGEVACASFAGLVSPALWWAIRLARIARKHGEKSAFLDLLMLFPSAYRRRAGTASDAVRARVLDRSWRHPLDMINWELGREVEVSLSEPEQIASTQWYITSATRVFNDLLKASIDDGNVEAFRRFGEALDRVLEQVQAQELSIRQDTLTIQLESGELNDTHRRRLEQELGLVLARSAVVEGVSSIRRVIWFGIASWLLREFEGGRLPDNLFDPMLDIARGHFGDLAALSCVFASIVRSGESILDWDGWVVAQLPEGKVHSIDTTWWMRSFYCVQGLRLTPSELPVHDTPVLPAREFEYQFEHLESFCAGLETGDPWRRIIPDTDLQRIDGFVELNKRAVSLNRQLEEDRLIESQLSEAKWRRFKEEFTGSWQGSSTMRRLVTEYGVVEARTGKLPPDEVPTYAVDEPVDKGAFVDEWHVAHLGYAESRGIEMAHTENGLVLHAIRSGLCGVREVDPGNVADGMLSAVETLRSAGYSPTFCAIDQSQWPFRAFMAHAGFQPEWDAACEPLDVVQFRGRLAGVPVLVTAGILGRHVIVADLGALGRWIQYQVTAESGEIIGFSLAEYDEDSAEQIVRANAPYFEGLTSDEALRRVRTKVHLKILQRFEYIVDDPKAGMVLEVKPGASA